MRIRHLSVALLAVGGGVFAATAAAAQGNDADFCLDTPKGTPVNTYNCPVTTTTAAPGTTVARPPGTATTTTSSTTSTTRPGAVRATPRFTG